MKRQIRRNTFETNSSSTHAICISKTPINPLPENLPNKVDFELGEFGWENDRYDTTYDKASYLYTAICEIVSDRRNKAVALDKIRTALSKYNIECYFEPDEFGDGYIDHAGETIDFVKAVINDEEKLLTYLFGDSMIITGNDNEDGFNNTMYQSLGIKETKYGTYEEYDYDHYKEEFSNYEIYEKGN